LSDSSQLEGTRRPPSHSELLEKPELKFHGIALAPYVTMLDLAMCSVDDDAHSELSDIYVTCQLVADNKPLTIPFRTSFKAFKNGYMYVKLYCVIYLAQRI
jgi:phosphatidylinositol 3-kinase